MMGQTDNTETDLKADREVLLAMAERWSGQEHMRTSRHNALFHLQTTVHRLDSLLAEFIGFDPVPTLPADDLAHLPEDTPE